MCSSAPFTLFPKSRTTSVSPQHHNIMTSLFKSRTTSDPIYLLLNARDEKERDELTKRWKDNKLSELSFVGIVVRSTCIFTSTHI